MTSDPILPPKLDPRPEIWTADQNGSYWSSCLHPPWAVSRAPSGSPQHPCSRPPIERLTRDRYSLFEFIIFKMTILHKNGPPPLFPYTSIIDFVVNASPQTKFISSKMFPHTIQLNSVESAEFSFFVKSCIQTYYFLCKRQKFYHCARTQVLRFLLFQCIEFRRTMN